MDTEVVQLTTPEPGICLITLSRPHVRNAVDPPTAQKLYDAFLAFENDSSLQVCVFHGSNGTFCAGADLHAVSAMKPSNATYLQPVADRNIGPMGPSRLQIKKPVIAAVAGYAVAGGLELSLLGDMRVVEESAVFGVFCRRWGVPLIDGGTVRLQKVIGLGRAMDMILTGRPVGAQEALQMGLANRVVPDGKSLEEATALARSLLQFPQGCMRADRDSAYYAAYDASSFEDAMQNEFSKGFKVLATESVSGASRFSSGQGRHGSFDIHKSKI
ncbi:hypothetical protein H2198_010837 [Neophaeococcomyces mojaviensis]|uniref:Uncharacterized protein n=1 Tax=Neophaeococcomyces mojaviensis TaxID=3383035 RepID=A0ACC2ZQJ0_9EURO|nr:hypothetical protein H2198_010837 [Knufia sp. JES_112]